MMSCYYGEIKSADSYDRLIQSKPEFSSNKEALEVLSRELEAIAANENLTIDELILKAESGARLNENYLNALCLDRRVTRLRR